jgi:tetratricopeptide (TPR) repeat protein
VLVTAGEVGEIDGTVMIFEDEQQPDTTNLMETPILHAFPRVLWIGDVERPAVLRTFVFADLIARLRTLRSMPREQRRQMGTDDVDRTVPVKWAGVREGFEQLARTSRAAMRSRFAAQYFGSVATLALMEGDALGAMEATIAQLALLMVVPLRPTAQSVAASFLKTIDLVARGRWNDDPEFVVAYARLVAECVRPLVPDDLQRAETILAASWIRCQKPLNRRALSTLATSTAWMLRATTDVDGVLSAGNRAFELAPAEKPPRETAAALTVLGATFDDLGDFPNATATLRKAAAVISDNHYPVEAWLIRIRLATVFIHAGQPDAARSALDEAVRIAKDGGLGTWAGEAEFQRSKLDGKTQA